MSLLDRAWKLDRAIDERAAGRVEPLDVGIALFSEDLPSVYDANLLRIDSGLDGLDPDSLEQLVESVQRDLDHRKLILPDGDVAERLARTLGRRGWQLAPTDVMEYVGPPER